MNIFKAIKTFLFGQTEEEFLAELDAEEEACRKVFESDSEDENHTPPVLSESKLQEMTCQFRTGVITRKDLTYGLIDNKYEFPSDTAIGLNEGQEVSFVVYKKKGRDIVCNVSAVDNDDWDLPDSNKKKIRTNLVFDKKLIGQVTVRNGRKITIEPNSVQCDLNKIESEFIPIVGDWVIIEIVVTVDDLVVDLTGEVLSVEKIRPLRMKTLNAHVTSWNGVEGVLDRNCHFFKDACELGYIPSIGDEVIAEIMESEQECNAWRALTIIPSQCQKFRQIKAESISRNRDDLTVDKCGVVVSRDENFVDMKLRQIKQIEIQVKNESNEIFQISCCRFHSRVSNSQLRLVSPSMNDTIDLPPNKTVTYVIECNAKFIGRSRELLVFYFNDFKIGRWIDIDVCSPISNTVGNGPSFSQREKHKIHYSQRNDVVYQGVKPRRAPSFVPINMGHYFIPERIKYRLLDAMSSENSKDDIEFELEEIIPSLRKPLNFNSYNDYFHNLLYLEEAEMIIDIRKYDIARGHFIPNDEYLMLYVENLHERRPSLMIGDRIIVSEPESLNKPKFEGCIHKVTSQHIYLKFIRGFHENYDRREYQIEFQFSRTTLKRCHQAIMLAVKHFNDAFLFPSTYKLKSPQFDVKPEALKFLNKDLNEIQKKAIVNILDGSARPLPYVIFGPPGTGKTVTIVETILQILNNITDSRILVATPSNSSADLITYRLLDANVLLPGDLVRLVSYRSCVEATVPLRLIPFSATADIAQEGTRRSDDLNIKQSNFSTLGRHRITVGTCASLGVLYNMGFPRGHFSHLVVDEAGQATEPEIMIPITLIDPSSGQIILAGDPMQLGPVVSRFAGRFGLEESFLIRLLRRYPYQRDTQTFAQSDGFDPRLVTRLLYNYRSLPEILKLSSDMFYDSQLIPTISAEDSNEAKLLMSIAVLLPKSETNKIPAIVFHGVRGCNQRDGDSPSWYNAQEATQIYFYVMKLLQLGIKVEDIGIISPYNKQVKAIKTLLMARELDDLPKMGSVEEFQGQERNIIFVSTVRSENSLIETDMKYKLGFISNPQRFNVAITRARAINIIVGDPHVLSRDTYWRSLLNYCVENDSYVGCDLPTEYDT